ncbi:unnamed protein product [Arctogadus glacialis]
MGVECVDMQEVCRHDRATPSHKDHLSIILRKELLKVISPSVSNEQHLKAKEVSLECGFVHTQLDDVT